MRIPLARRLAAMAFALPLFSAGGVAFTATRSTAAPGPAGAAQID
ncbi:hypothetical protein [Streptomyces sp. HNM0574]|nr:hypothetical protein [Streptomyces sp. HNM0574]